MEIILTVILILILFQFLPVILIVTGIINIVSGNIIIGIVLLLIGLSMNGS